MSAISFAVKIAPEIRKRVKQFCNEHGIKQGFFVQKALEEKLEREEMIEDLLDFKKLKSQEKEAISFEQYLKQRNV